MDLVEAIPVENAAKEPPGNVMGDPAGRAPDLEPLVPGSHRVVNGHIVSHRLMSSPIKTPERPAITRQSTNRARRLGASLDRYPWIPQLTETVKNVLVLFSFTRFD
ncbi:hypothetical protein [Bosea sp. FBZP-16]|uniref:hypothetical protein n=1 Tax=Bosea sp. FBZP-16 TaxID=2065382 RepID=UPI00131A0147|nr:hypothetical protein [Bosea sp. FBZP-16]